MTVLHMPQGDIIFALEEMASDLRVAQVIVYLASPQGKEIGLMFHDQ